MYDSDSSISGGEDSLRPSARRVPERGVSGQPQSGRARSVAPALGIRSSRLQGVYYILRYIPSSFPLFRLFIALL